MASIRIGTETHQKLKSLASKQGSTLTDLLAEVTSLLATHQLAPAQVQAKLEAAHQLASLQEVITAQTTKVLKLMAQHERTYLFPVTQEVALIKAYVNELAARQENGDSLGDIAERLEHLTALIQAQQQKVDQLYQLIMEV